MARHSESSIMRLGAISLVVLLLVMAAAFNLQKFPGFRGTTYHADFTDASGLARGDMVQIAGVRVGRVDSIEIHDDHVQVNFDVHDASFGTKTSASVEVLNLLGSKFLNLKSAGSEKMDKGGTIPLSRTSASYDIVSTLDELTTRTEAIDTDQLATALNTLAGTIDSAAPQVHDSFTGISRLSRTIAERDDDLGALLQHADQVTALLAKRKTDLVALMKSGDQVFAELRQRREAIHSLLVNANRLAVALRGIVADNRQQIGPVLADLQTVIGLLHKREQSLKQTIHNLGPYASTLINVIGTGPWFDSYVPNLVGLATGEFVPGNRPTTTGGAP
ncbi:MCE family protein [Marmoricola sp. RAF53]|uniref:MCE family protein n=1 Tax=Marmoricola sp. RAF53 TaxID=3233059 RepID=UPI003F9B6E4C